MYARIFAAQGHLTQTIPSLILGILFGYSMKMSGLWIAKITEESHLINLPHHKKAVTL